MAKEQPQNLISSRPPIVVVMGHVDHGKTSLLDYIRHTDITSRESGGITQHIGAYQVKVPHEGSEKLITFIDTPGHEAFSAMRARGGQVADIAILVVAADDGVMPQTKEAIAHIKAAAIPMIVAINKMDMPGANEDRVKKGLADNGVLVEGYGGDVVAVPVSAKTGQGVDHLLEMILLTAELLELTGNNQDPPQGTVIESRLDHQRGPLATVIIKNGTLLVGQMVLVGGVSGRVKALLDGFGVRIKAATPAMPVEILGLSDVPEVGSQIGVAGKEHEEVVVPTQTLAELLEQEKKSDQINLIIKADVAGSLEAIKGSLNKLDQEITKLNILHLATGEISESDINLARATGALVLAFRVKTPPAVLKLAETQEIQVMSYDVIYKLLDDLQDALAGIKLDERPEPVGIGDIIATFPHNKTVIFGIRVKDGVIGRDQPAKVMREDTEIASGRVRTIKHLKEELPRAEAGKEYGILLDLPLETYSEIKEGDKIYSFPKK